MKKTMLVCLLMAMVLSGCSSTSGSKVDSNAQTTQSTEQKSSVKYIMAGKIDANVASKISGKVSKVLVDIGSKVNAGDTVIQLDTQDLQAQVDQAEAAVKVSQANLTNAESSARQEQLAQEVLNMHKNGSTESSIDIYKA